MQSHPPSNTCDHERHNDNTNHQSNSPKFATAKILPMSAPMKDATNTRTVFILLLRTRHHECAFITHVT